MSTLSKNKIDCLIKAMNPSLVSDWIVFQNSKKIIIFMCFILCHNTLISCSNNPPALGIDLSSDSSLIRHKIQLMGNFISDYANLVSGFPPKNFFALAEHFKSLYNLFSGLLGLYKTMSLELQSNWPENGKELNFQDFNILLTVSQNEIITPLTRFRNILGGKHKSSKNDPNKPVMDIELESYFNGFLPEDLERKQNDYVLNNKGEEKVSGERVVHCEGYKTVVKNGSELCKLAYYLTYIGILTRHEKQQLEIKSSIHKKIEECLKVLVESRELVNVEGYKVLLKQYTRRLLAIGNGTLKFPLDKEESSGSSY